MFLTNGKLRKHVKSCCQNPSFVFHLPSALFAYSSSTGNQQRSLLWAFHLCFAFLTGSFLVAHSFKFDLCMRGAVSCVRVFTFLISKGCNVCEEGIEGLFTDEDTNQWIGKCRWMVDFISLGLWKCKCRIHSVAQNVCQGKALTDGACLIFMHMNANFGYRKKCLAMGFIATTPCGKALVFFDADPRCWGIGWPFSSLGTLLEARARKEPTTTETKEAILLLRQAQSLGQQSFRPCVCKGMTSHANSTIGCFSSCLLFSLVVFVIAVVLSAETEELKDERAPERVGGMLTCQPQDLPLVNDLKHNALWSD